MFVNSKSKRRTITMTYAKPELVTLTAVKAIQGVDKVAFSWAFDWLMLAYRSFTPTAYLADE